MYLKIIFGLELEDKVFPYGDKTEGGTHYHGPKGLLLLLESHFGLIGFSEKIDYLRIAQYRQALQEYLKEHKTAFYKRAYEADQLATAEELLTRRDELLLAGWNFEIVEGLPDRLAVLANIEALVGEEGDINLPDGFADRFVKVLSTCEKKPSTITEICLNEPLEILPYHLQRLFKALASNGTAISQLSSPVIEGTSDLQIFQNAISGKQVKTGLKKDGSLLILKAKRDTDAAAFLAKLLDLNPSYRPACLIPEKTRVLDNALIQENLPSLGILSASLARPTLQILKLATVFLWRPIDPHKVLEFVTLPVKPLENDLAVIIARLIASRPGLNSDSWYAAINQYFEELDERKKTEPNLDVEAIKKQYQFWFERKRYNSNKSVPKEEVIEIFDYVSKWASQTFETEGSVNQSLLVLSEQSKRIKELMEALPDSYNFITNLELERIVRTIYSPSPVQFKEVEMNHLPFLYHASAFIQTVPDLLWWNFSQSERASFFSKWYQIEINFLKNIQIDLENPQRKNARLIWQRKRPVLQAVDRLVLVIPERVEGSVVLAHPLQGDMEATFGELAEITYDVDTGANASILEGYFQMPEQIVLKHRPLIQPQAVLKIKETAFLDDREHETFTSLNSLLYFPYQWVFRHKLRLHKSSLLSVVRDKTLMGNLSHRFIELLLKDKDIATMQKEDVNAWIDDKKDQLFAREGATLLMYGREPERVAFLNKIKFAAWSLVSTIQNNSWQVKETEMDLKGKFSTIPIKAKADLVLEREGETAVLDLKWSGSNYRKRIIKNEEDLQLVLYSKLFPDSAEWSHTGYFILDKGELIARNNQAFSDCTALNVDADHIAINERILSKMEATFKWRLDQLKKGQIEIRTKQTQLDLEELYAGTLMDLLEMKDGNAPFDDYKVLIGGN